MIWLDRDEWRKCNRTIDYREVERLRGFQRPTDVAAFQGYRVGERMPTKERESEDHAWYIEFGRGVSKEASDRQCLDLKW